MRAGIPRICRQIAYRKEGNFTFQRKILYAN